MGGLLISEWGEDRLEGVNGRRKEYVAGEDRRG